jgi:hypothetical protein
MEAIRFPHPGFWAIQIWLTALILLYSALRETIFAFGPAAFTVRFFGPRLGERLVRRFGEGSDQPE